MEKGIFLLFLHTGSEFKSWPGIPGGLQPCRLLRTLHSAVDLICRKRSKLGLRVPIPEALSLNLQS